MDSFLFPLDSTYFTKDSKQYEVHIIYNILVKLNPQATNKIGHTYLHLLTSYQKYHPFLLKIIEHNLLHMFDLNKQDNYGNTPLDLCNDTITRNILFEHGFQYNTTSPPIEYIIKHMDTYKKNPNKYTKYNLYTYENEKLHLSINTQDDFIYAILLSIQPSNKIPTLDIQKHLEYLVSNKYPFTKVTSNNNNLLHVLCKSYHRNTDYYDVILYCLKNTNLSVNSLDDYGYTPLQHVDGTNKDSFVPLIKLFLQHGLHMDKSHKLPYSPIVKDVYIDMLLDKLQQKEHELHAIYNLCQQKN